MPLRRAVLPSTQLQGEGRERVREQQTWRSSDQTLAAVVSPPEPSRRCLCVRTLLMEGRLPSSLSQLAWLGEESRAAQETVTHGKGSMGGNSKAVCHAGACTALGSRRALRLTKLWVFLQLFIHHFVFSSPHKHRSATKSLKMLLAVRLQSCAYKECPNKIKPHLVKLSFNYHRQGTDRLRSRSVEKDLGILEDCELDVGQQCALTVLAGP